MYVRLGLYVQIRLYYVLPYKAKISAHHGIGFILDRCIVYCMEFNATLTAKVISWRLYCVLRTNHAKFATETSAYFQNIQH